MANLGRALGDKTGHHERRAAAQVVRGHLRAGETGDAVNHDVMALDANLGAHAPELRREHEAVLEDVLCNDGAAAGQRGKDHDLGLHVGGESGNGSVWMSTGLMPPATRRTCTPPSMRSTSILMSSSFLSTMPR